MPKEYKHCVQSELDKGRKLKDAQRICAISYYKNHGRTPQQDEKKGSFDNHELALFGALPVLVPVLDEEYADKKKEHPQETKTK